MADTELVDFAQRLRRWLHLDDAARGINRRRLFCRCGSGRHGNRANMARFAWRRRLRSWIPIRLVGMLQLVWGVVVPERQKLSYLIREVYPNSSRSLG